MILTKREELRKGIEEDALAFARLTRAPISAAFLNFYRTDFYKFREAVRELLAMDRDVEKVLIVNDRGQVLFDSAELQEVSRPPAALTPRLLQEPERLAAAARREDTVIHGRNADGDETLEVFTPYLRGRSRPAPHPRLPGLLPPPEVGHRSTSCGPPAA